MNKIFNKEFTMIKFLYSIIISIDDNIILHNYPIIALQFKNSFIYITSLFKLSIKVFS